MGASDRKAHLWSIRTGRLIRSLGGGAKDFSLSTSTGTSRPNTTTTSSTLPHNSNSSGVNSVSFDPSGLFLSLGAGGNCHRIFDFYSGVCVGGSGTSGTAHGGVILSSAFLPDCKRVITAGMDGLMVVWRLGPTITSVQVSRLKELGIGGEAERRITFPPPPPTPPQTSQIPMDTATATAAAEASKKRSGNNNNNSSSSSNEKKGNRKITSDNSPPLGLHFIRNANPGVLKGIIVAGGKRASPSPPIIPPSRPVLSVSEQHLLMDGSSSSSSIQLVSRSGDGDTNKAEIIEGDKSSSSPFLDGSPSTQASPSQAAAVRKSESCSTTRTAEREPPDDDDDDDVSE